ncbi:MAG: hypothetical protein M3O26_03290 [Pseudomonadota bacterium]|nr:hypothetical protein [Pseudomonadota bacterium]
MAYFRARFCKHNPKVPTLHQANCPEAQFVDPKPKQEVGQHESGDKLRNVDAITSAKAYQLLDKKYPGTVKVCRCAEGTTLKAVLEQAASR